MPSQQSANAAFASYVCTLSTQSSTASDTSVYAMNPRTQLFFSLLSLGLIGIASGCKSEPIELSLHPKVGVNFGVILNMSQRVVEERSDIDVESRQDVSLQWRQTVDGIGPSGNAMITLKYERARMSASNPSFGVMHYDSQSRNDSIPLLAIGLEAVIGEEVKLEIDQHGEIVSVIGIEAFATRVANKLQLPAGIDAVEVRASVRNWFSEDAVREMMRPIFSIYPDGPVQTGDSWVREVPVQRPIPHVQRNEYELESFDARKAILSVRSELIPLEQESNQDGAVIIDVEGTLRGTLHLDRATGYVVLGEIYQELEGTITMTTSDGEKIVTPMTLDGSIKFAAEL
ncbi:MAG: hypothetical protein ACI8TQ_002091 [Planctomycetota bacterium]|jgi:hypothetical protein